jgi:hypothetical protein
VFTHSGLLSELDVKGAAGGQKLCRFFESFELAEAVFVAIYEKQVSRGWQKAILNSDLIGSEKVHSSLGLLSLSTVFFFFLSSQLLSLSLSLPLSLSLSLSSFSRFLYLPFLFLTLYFS